ncbi:MAG: hypothetical protein WAT26_13250 [Saprospiraceae bacterium]
MWSLKCAFISSDDKNSQDSYLAYLNTNRKYFVKMAILNNFHFERAHWNIYLTADLMQ